MISSILIEPRYQETDQMGIIHHSVYPIWYEMARVKYCEDIGLPFHEIKKRNVRLAMFNMSSKYIKPTYFGKRYHMETKCVKLSKVRLFFSYHLYDENHELVHEGQTELIWLNHNLKPTNIEKSHKDIYELFLKEVII